MTAINIALQPKQRRLIEVMEGPSTLIGYGGARGGAKSFAIRAAALYRRIRYPGTSALIFRRVYDQLWQQHITRFAVEYPDIYRTSWSAEHKAIILPDNSTILFRYGTSMKDILQFRGKEYGDIFIDEATDMTEEELKILYSCCRSSVLHGGFTPKKVLTFNPGGIGHAYVKRVFIDMRLTPEEGAQNPVFIQAYAWDNVIWVSKALARDGFTAADYYSWTEDQRREYLIRHGDYGKELNALPEHLRKAWLYGDWNSYVGQAFSDFSYDLHVVDAFDIPSHWARWMSNDLGFASPGVWLLFAADEDGNVYVTRERTFIGQTALQQAEQMRLETDISRLDFWVTGADAWNRESGTGKAVVDYYMAGGLPSPIRPITNRVTGAMVVHEYLKPRPGPDGTPVGRLRIFRQRCPKLIETLPILAIDPTNPEVVQDGDMDHWYDALRYGLCAWHTTRSAPRTAVATTNLASILGHHEITEARPLNDLDWLLAESRADM